MQIHKMKVLLVNCVTKAFGGVGKFKTWILGHAQVQDYRKFSFPRQFNIQKRFLIAKL